MSERVEAPAQAQATMDRDNEVIFDGVTGEAERAAHRLFGATSGGHENPEHLVKYYDQVWSEHYDGDAEILNYNVPVMGCELVVRTLGHRTDARILDAASGTGTCGKYMKEKGYTNIDATDASQNMLEISKKHGAYKNYYVTILGHEKLPVPDDTYDMVITVGSFIPGHLDEKCFEELARVTKPGGYIGIMMWERYFVDHKDYSGNIDPRMLELQELGVWKRLRRDIFPNYNGNYPGVEFMLQMCDGKNEKLNEIAKRMRK